MSQVQKPELPIGYWIKRVDRLLSERIDDIQATNGVSRSEWQVLNLLSEAGSTTKERVFESMRTFIDAPSLDEILARFHARGWTKRSEDLESGTEELQLTELGRGQHATILSTQQKIRQRAMRGVSADEYAMVIRILQRMADNLERNSPD
jgi:DNA-binding MarR family transcriptional regulator